MLAYFARCPNNMLYISIYLINLIISARNKSASDQIFGYVRDYFAGLDFLFKNSSQARILSGQEEGINAWISANYFENNFDVDPSLSSYFFSRNSNKKTSNSRTKGILDLGGASTQITYVPSGKQKIINKNGYHCVSPL